MPGKDTLFIPLGHRCSSTAMLDRCRLGGESLPFHSIVCQLGVVKDCLQHGFKAFLDPDNYVKTTIVTVNVVDDVVEFHCNELPSVNRHYRGARKPDGKRDLIDSSTYHQQLALTHHDFARAPDRETFARRVRRLCDLLEEDRRKVYVYSIPSWA